MGQNWPDAGRSRQRTALRVALHQRRESPGRHSFCFLQGQETTERFLGFIEKRRRGVWRPIILIADNASYRTGPRIKAYCEHRAAEVLVHNLPAYAFELNPDEQVWNFAKARLGKIPFIPREHMKAAAQSVMWSIQANAELILSFFRLKDTAYAPV